MRKGARCLPHVIAKARETKASDILEAGHGGAKGSGGRDLGAEQEERSDGRGEI